MLALLQHTDQLAQLRAEPALLRPAVEELLRYAGPLETASERYAWEDVTVAGVTIPRGEQVFAAVASANRDGRQFPDPDRLDITRENIEQFAFGHGVHTCLGAPLARLLAGVGVNALVQRLPGLRLAADALESRKHFILHGVQALPVRFRPAP